MPTGSTGDLVGRGSLRDDQSEPATTLTTVRLEIEYQGELEVGGEEVENKEELEVDQDFEVTADVEVGEEIEVVIGPCCHCHTCLATSS